MPEPPRVRSCPDRLTHSLPDSENLSKCMLGIPVARGDYPSLGTSQGEWRGTT